MLGRAKCLRNLQKGPKYTRWQNRESEAKTDRKDYDKFEYTKRKKKQYAAEYRKKFPEKVKAAMKAWRDRNREYYQAYQKEWRENNREYYREQQKEYIREHRKKTHKEYLEYQKEYRERRKKVQNTMLKRGLECGIGKSMPTKKQ